MNYDALSVLYPLYIYNMNVPQHNLFVLSPLRNEMRILVGSKL